MDGLSRRLAQLVVPSEDYFQTPLSEQLQEPFPAENVAPRPGGYFQRLPLVEVDALKAQPSFCV